MKSFLLFHLLVLDLAVFSLMVSGEPGVTYYVKPSQSTKCPGQPCETMNYYLKHVDTTINKEKKLTMILLNGNHSLDHFKDNLAIKTPIIKMIGESETILKPQGLYPRIHFENNSEVYFKSFVMINLTVVVHSDLPNSYLHMSALNISGIFSLLDISITVFMENTEINGPISLQNTYAVLTECKFYYYSVWTSLFTRLEIKDCSFYNSPLRLFNNSIVSGITNFTDTQYDSAISCYYGANLTLSGNVTFANNSATRGGALALYFCTVNIAANTSVTFVNNTAKDKGGAIYVEPGISPSNVVNYGYEVKTFPCFYQLLNCHSKNTYNFYFANNSASFGGDEIYGAFLKSHSCSNCNLTMNISSPSNSSVSSDALRVCLCDEHGQPQCKNNSYLENVYTSKIYPGEIFNISAVLVGADFGLTTGTVYADINYYVNSSTPSLTVMSDSNFITSISQCSEVEYSLYLYPINAFVDIYLITIPPDNLIFGPTHCRDESCIQTANVFITFNIQLPCPPGFIITGSPPHCDCHNMLTRDFNITCHIKNGDGLFSWTGNLWVGILENNVTAYTKHCPHNYCKTFNGTEKIDLRNNSTYQCELNRRGRLCGECKEGYSLAIGSSHCIHCTNNNNLALLIFFAAAGFLLVIFVGLLNLSVSTGTINGLIFYANIIWTYKEIFFKSEGESSAVLIFLKSFIAWVNLDFGIETCFVKGLTAFWKTWLQFIFPFYIWAIAGLIILASRYSFRLTKLLGNRALPLLATLFLLSYMKLLRTVGSTLEFSVISTIPFEDPTKLSSEVVWSVDGSLSYFSFPHIFLFVTGFFTLLFLWLPYTLLLFLMQWLRRLPHVGIIKWIMRLHPLYDSYFAPLKPKHQYWFGALLLARGILHVTFASTFAIPQNVNLLLLLIIGTLLTFYMARTHPYKSLAVLLFNCIFFMNLTLLSGFFFFTYTQPYNGATLRSVAIGLSTGVSFLQFCCAVLTAIVKPCCFKSRETLEVAVPGQREPARNSSGYRDSIFNESEPLLPTY